MVTLHPATSLDRIGFMRGHIALLTTGSAHLGECEYLQTGKRERAPDRVLPPEFYPLFVQEFWMSGPKVFPVVRCPRGLLPNGIRTS
jgi:hypothetical protein